MSIKKVRRCGVTVCIAAICEGNTVFGASDRMLTSGDIEFEPLQEKIYQMTTSIAIMLAGDSALQSEILQKVRLDVYERIQHDPQNWWAVEDVAALYSRFYSEAKLKRSEAAILNPLGLNRGTFIERQQQMAASLVSQLAQQMINFEIPKVEAIITGIDSTGAHIYVVEDGDASCADSVGFASIGAGRWHANTQFMFAGHTRSSLGPRTLLLVFSAKRRAEVAPGVGEGTDMFMVPYLGRYTPIGTHVLKELDKAYKGNQRGINRSSRKAEKGFANYLDQLAPAQASPEQKASRTTEQPPEAGAVSSGSEQKDKPEQEGQGNQTASSGPG